MCFPRISVLLSDALCRVHPFFAQEFAAVVLIHLPRVPGVVADNIEDRSHRRQSTGVMYSQIHGERGVLLSEKLTAFPAVALRRKVFAEPEIADADYPELYLVNIEHCFFINDNLDISMDTQIPHPHGHGSPIICNMKDWKYK